MVAAKRFRVEPALSGLEDFQFGAGLPLREFILLGRPAEFGATKRVSFDVGTEHVLAIVGKRGSGKSFTLGSIAEALVTKSTASTLGSHPRRCAVLLLDTLNIYPYTEIPLSKVSELPLIRSQAELLNGWAVEVEDLDVTVWAPAGHRWAGMLSHYRDFSIACSDLELEDWATILGVDTATEPQGQLLADIYEAVVQAGVEYDLTDLDDALGAGHPAVAVYHDETVRALRRQLRAHARDGLFGRTGTPLNELLRAGNLAVVMTNQLSDDLRGVLTSVLVRKTLRLRSRAAFARKQLAFNEGLAGDERLQMQDSLAGTIPPVWLLIDEAQNVTPSGRRTPASEALIKLVREGRNSGISVVITTQQPSAIDQRVLAQVDTMMVHQLVTQPDIDAIRRNQKSNDPREVKYGNDRLTFDELIRSLSVGQCVVSSTDAPRWFVCSTRPRVSAHGGIGAASAEA